MQGKPAAQFRPPLTATNIPIPVTAALASPATPAQPPVPGRRRSGIATRRALTVSFGAAATH